MARTRTQIEFEDDFCSRQVNRAKILSSPRRYMLAIAQTDAYIPVITGNVPRRH